MRSLFVPILSAIILSSVPSSHAFNAPDTTRFPPTRRGFHRASTVGGPASPRTPVEDDANRGAAAVPRRTPVGRFAAESLTAAGILLGTAASAWGVSGGGLDYAGLDLSGQDFSNGNYKGKDFTQTIAKAATFANSNLQGCRFYKAYLVNVNFEGADARGASFEDTSMDGANLRNVNAAGSYFGQSLLDVETLEGGDFTDAQVPVKTLKLVCEREDVKGTNPSTGADTRDSLMCL